MQFTSAFLALITAVAVTATLATPASPLEDPPTPTPCTVEFKSILPLCDTAATLFKGVCKRQGTVTVGGTPCCKIDAKPGETKAKCDEAVTSLLTNVLGCASATSPDATDIPLCKPTDTPR